MKWQTRENAIAMMKAFGWRHHFNSLYPEEETLEFSCAGCETRQIATIGPDGYWTMNPSLGTLGHPPCCGALATMHATGWKGLADFAELLAATGEAGSFINKEQGWKIREQTLPVVRTILREFYPEAADALEFPASRTRTEREK